jgi:hypothetical protein
MDTGFQLWDRNTGNLIAEFGDREKALSFLREQVDGLDARQAQLEVERMAFLSIDGDGRSARTIAEGSGVLDLIMAPTGADGS